MSNLVTLICKLTDSQLESTLQQLVRKERHLLHEILLHIREVDRRRLFLDRARSSLFDYLVNDLGYSSSAAQRRIEASRLLIQVPELAGQIQQGKINLTQVGELSRALKEKERETGERVKASDTQALLQKIEHKNSHETQKIVAQELNLALRPLELKQVQRDESVSVQISFTREQYAKLLAAKDKLAHLHQQQNKGSLLADVIETLCDQVLKKEIKEQKEMKESKLTAPVVVGGFTESSSRAQGSRQSLGTARDFKSVHKGLRLVSGSAKPSCQFYDSKTGRECRSTFALEEDHIHPLWAGGSDSPENIQILCAAHNKHRYRKQAGIRAVAGRAFQSK